MSHPLVLRSVSALVSLLVVASSSSQQLPAKPPSLDPAFWGRPNAPYILTLSHTNTISVGTAAPQTTTEEEKVYRDSHGRVRTEDFNFKGQLVTVTIQDPIKNTWTFMKVAEKTVSTQQIRRFGAPPPGKGWIIEPLPSRVLAGVPAEGFRFTRTIAASADGSRPAETIVEDDWLSNKLGVVLERTDQSQRIGKTEDVVSEFRQVEPDPILFTVSRDYSRSPQPVSRR
jgi:hypothetical protein